MVALDEIGGKFTLVQVENDLSHSSTRTKLTPNTFCVITPLGDDNATTQLVFYQQEGTNDIPWWSPSLSAANIKITLDQAAGPYRKGFHANYITGAGIFTVTCTGRILDGDTVYRLNGKYLGTVPM